MPFSVRKWSFYDCPFMIREMSLYGRDKQTDSCKMSKVGTIMRRLHNSCGCMHGRSAKGVDAKARQTTSKISSCFKDFCDFASPQERRKRPTKFRICLWLRVRHGHHRCQRHTTMNYWDNATIITRLPSNLRKDHPWMRAFSYSCSLPVTWQRWRLHRSICPTRKPHAARKHHGYMFDRMGVIADQSLTLQK